MKKLLLAAAIFAGGTALTGCASADSALKGFESNTKGLDRTIQVYDETGKVVAEYEGVIRVHPTEAGNKVVFEVDGKRMGIYNLGVVIEEK